ncbi:class I adenylate-forming enzyme family protein [Halobacterium litoreum]|uniref:Acetyl-CoA synthetase n=1 Tax=Halobacterium litoreum TaxID=2039234 RepID=A0ABD5NGZ9_9EURY|nr:hypothetical protein [Halobacterium litoreum]UHH12556.1 hypothetical protein LT972_10355 [Halobacterium litoreum]
METLADVVGSLDDPDRPAVRAGRVHDARETRSRIYKTGNALRHRGVREDAGVAILDVAAPQAIHAFFGAALLGSTVRFGPDRVVESRVLAGPTERLGEYDLPPGGQRVGWGSPPADPSWMHFERDVWSENPAFPEPDVTAATGVLPGVTHGELVAAAESVAAELDGEDVVAVRAPLSHPGTVAAGVVAPLVAGASVLLPSDGETGTVAVTTGDAPEERAILPDDAAPE